MRTRARPLTMAKAKIEKTVGVYDRPEKKINPWTAVVIVAAVLVAVAIAVFIL